MEILARTVSGHWRPGIGDPTVIGWVTVVCYFAAATLCLRDWRIEQAEVRSGRRGLHPGFWLAVGIAMILLGINKQLDLQSWFSEVGRAAAHSEGWYAQRREVQYAFILSVAAAGLGCIIAMGWWLRRDLRRYGLTIAGIAYLVAFIVIRAALFHHVDRVGGIPVGALRVNHILEIGGIVCVGLGAWRIA